MVGWIGDPAEKLNIGLYSDADFAGDVKASKSTSGVSLKIEGENSCFPISGMSKKQTAVSHSSAEAEVISLDACLRLEGIPALQLWQDVLDIFHPRCGRRRLAIDKPKEDVHPIDHVPPQYAT